MASLNELRKIVFESDNNACFIEKERIFKRLESEMTGYRAPDRYARILSELLDEVSTPVLDCDYFAGRVVEALPEEGMSVPNTLLCSDGHKSLDYAKLLSKGLRGILEEIHANATAKGDAEALSFAKNAEIVVSAIRRYALRYSTAAAEKGFGRMADALKKVPYEPAYDFYSALQSVWLIHMIASCYVGSRDYAFGRFDQYMQPFYEKALAEGQTEQELTELLAGFMIKTNEICGRTTHNHQTKPVLCHASKQYMNIGGETPNRFSSVVLNAAKMNNMAQPTIVVLLQADADEQFTKDVFDALSVLTDKMHLYNYDLIVKALVEKGISRDVAKDFSYSACCAFDLNYHTNRIEYYAPVPQLFLEVFRRREYESLDQLTSAFSDELKADFQKFVDEAQRGWSEDRARREYVLDSLLLSDSAVECRYACDGKAEYNMLNIFCPGLATIGDSLMALDKMVFEEKRYSYREFAEIVENNFENHDELLKEIRSCVMFGNDSDNDRYTVMAANAILDAVEGLETKDNFYTAPGFYSLERENTWCSAIGATPNGRKAGEPFSENQSPTYGADKNGITALLRSLAKLPFERTLSGGLNLTFSRKMPPEIFRTLVLSYFQMGGFHVGIGIVDRETLKDAMINPEKYRSLTVRLYGFSEYFISLPEWQQFALLNRTEYGR